MKREEIRQYIIKTIGRDPQDNFEVTWDRENEIAVHVRFSLRPKDDLVVTIPKK